jgi:hypothetical protein
MALKNYRHGHNELSMIDEYQDGPVINMPCNTLVNLATGVQMLLCFLSTATHGTAVQDTAVHNL